MKHCGYCSAANTVILKAQTGSLKQVPAHNCVSMWDADYQVNTTEMTWNYELHGNINNRSCLLRGCVALKLVQRVNRTNHSEAREKCRGPAGGLQLGPAQVQFPPRQGLHGVVVGADQLQVTASHPVPVVHPPGVRSPLWDPWGGGAHRHVQLTAHGTWWVETGETVNSTLFSPSPHEACMIWGKSEMPDNIVQYCDEDMN